MLQRCTALGFRPSICSKALAVRLRPAFSRSRLRLTQARTYRPYYPSGYGQQHYEQLGPSRLKRFGRSLLWINLSLFAGWIGGLVYIDWGYKAEVIRPDSPLDTELAMEIMNKIDQSPVIRSLTDDPSFSEVWPLAMDEDQAKAFSKPNYPPALQHILFTALRGTRGVFPRAFYSESRGVLCLVVGFGYGVAGVNSGRILHPGIFEILFHESMRLLAYVWFPEPLVWQLSKLDVNFSHPLPLQTVCCFTIMPASTVKDLPLIMSDTKLYGHWPKWLNTSDFGEKVNTFIGYAAVCSGHPLHDPLFSIGHACGKFETEGPDWPPPPPLKPLQLDADGKIT